MSLDDGLKRLAFRRPFMLSIHSESGSILLSRKRPLSAINIFSHLKYAY
ncbi:hypothetical protein NEISICOT_02572 [Neisseria sicca ATCC 29256]|uniref:Uncharacterized protein n=1 Tax=Neisseria sicca ATCC 29256 TaxID=547045 RepID=C6M7R0_NEISI|nr:hypothetical protein NEISICOT_02572 [Neisseria sicca ATCC 29256]